MNALSIECVKHNPEFQQMFKLTSLDMRWTNVHPDFQNSSKNYFTSIPSG